MFTFEGTRKKSNFKVYLKVHNPQFYWKVNASILALLEIILLS